MGGAAHDLARDIAGAVSREPVTLTVRNLSSLPAAQTASLRRLLDAELKTSPGAAAEVRVTLSENLTEFLLVAEIQRGEQRQVVVQAWPRSPGESANPPRDAQPQVTIEKRILWEQTQPVLDALPVAGGVLVLDAARILLVRGTESQSAPVVGAGPWPRDLRGRLSASDTSFTAWLPGTVCRGSLQPSFTAECAESQEPWPIAPGATAPLAPQRDFFQGRVEINGWGARDIPGFYSAAGGADSWVFAGIDGWAHIYSRGWEPAARIEHWGGDVAAVETSCGVRILATRPADAAEPDAVQPYELADGAANPAGAAVEFSGPVVALWAAGKSVTAISRDLQSGRYAAFSLVPACGL